MLRTASILVFVFFMLLGTVTWGRVFTDHVGQKFEATIVGRSSGHVLLMRDGNIQKTPLSKLSESDQQYIASYQARKVERRSPEVVDRTQFSKRSGKEKLPVERVEKSIRSYRSSELMSRYTLVENYAQDWPKTSYVVSPPILIVSEDKMKGRYVYQSPNYEFIADVKLSTTIISKFAHQFEATREYCSKIPLSLMIARLPGEKYRNRIYLFKNNEDYYRSGGMPQSLGMFNMASNEVLMPLSSLGVVADSGGINYDPTKTNATITHELVHQLTDNELYSEGARGWFTEGLAEYCAVTPYQSGRYTLATNQHNVLTYVTGFGRNGKAGRALGKKIEAPDLKSFMLQSYQSFTARGNENYGLALLVTYYFIHMEADRKNLNNFLQALKRGETGEVSLKHLLNGRSFEQLEMDIQKAWSANGLTLMFQ